MARHAASTGGMMLDATHLLSVFVTHCKNPLKRSEAVQTLVLAPPSTLGAFLEGNKLLAQTSFVTINGSYIVQDDLAKRSLRDGDHVEVMAVPGEPTSVAFFLFEELAFSEAAAIFIGEALGSLYLSAGLQLLQGALSGGGDTGGGASYSAEKAKEPYGLSGGGNGYRANQPLPLIMGIHRAFPDYGGRWFVDYVRDVAGETIVVNNTASYYDPPKPFVAFALSGSPAAPAAPWVNFAASNVTAWGDAQARAYDFVNTDPDTGLSETINITRAHSYVVIHETQGAMAWFVATFDNYLLWTPMIDDGTGNGTLVYYPPPPSLFTPYTPGTVPAIGTGNLPVLELYGYKKFENTQRFNAIYNFGFGDLTLSNHFVGTTPAADYHDLTIYEPVYSSTGTTVPGWKHASTTGAAPAIEFPSDVESDTNSGGLSKKPGEPGIWITRENKRLQATYLEIDLSGSLFYNGGGGPETRSVELVVEYGVAGSNTWTAAPFSPLTLSNGDLTAVRETRGWAVSPNIYAVRVRTNNDDSTDSRLKQEFSFERLKAYNTVTQTYPAQHRLGVGIRASKQLSGAMDRWSSLVSAKTWVYTGGATWDGLPIGTGSHWSWQSTTNPAWWYLYFLMGGFLNASVPVGHPLQGKGWMLGKHPANGQQLFGLGLVEARIDVASIIRWAAWCNFNNLAYSAVIDSPATAGDILSDIARVGRARVTRYSGKMGVIYFDVAAPVVQVFGMDNIVAGSFSVAYASDKTPDKVIVSFPDAAKDYAQNQVEAIVPGVTLPTTETSITIKGVTSAVQAQREANLVAAEQFYHRRRITWKTDLEGMIAQRGDVVQIAHDMTQWASSARVLRFIRGAAGTPAVNQIVALELTRNVVDEAAQAPYYILLRKPPSSVYFDLLTLQIEPPTTDSFVVTLTQPMSLADAAGSLDQLGEVNGQSIYPDSLPQDYLCLLGPAPIPGKRVRILAVQPSADGKVEITAADEVAAYYAHEFSPGTPTNYASGERLIARVTHAAAMQNESGRWVLTWELEHALGAIVSLSVNGSASMVIASGATLPGRELVLPIYPAGTHLAINLIPEPVVAAIGVVSDGVIVIV